MSYFDKNKKPVDRNKVKDVAEKQGTLLITKSIGHQGQWWQAVCTECREFYMRQQGGDQDDRAYAEFQNWCKQHKCKGDSNEEHF